MRDLYSMPVYFQNMKQVGKPVSSEDKENSSKIKEIEADIKERIRQVQEAGRSRESLNQAGQNTAMQRIELLVDKGSFCPLNSLLNPEGNKNGSTAVVKGLGRVNGKWAVIVASDNKKLAGAWVAGQAEN